MLRSQHAVLNMMRELELPLPHDDEVGPAVRNFIGVDFVRLRALVSEEADEFDEAMNYLEESLNLLRRTKGKEGEGNVNHGWAMAIDAMCDIIVVVHNTACAMNLDLEPFFNEVMATNLAKKGGPVREDGKRLKPEGWEEPKIQEILEDQLRRYGDLRKHMKEVKKLNLKEPPPHHTKDPIVALIYELVRDYHFHDTFRRMVLNQGGEHITGGWHLTDHMLAEFAEKTASILREQASKARLGDAVILEDFGGGCMIVGEREYPEQTDKEVRLAYARGRLDEEGKLKARFRRKPKVEIPFEEAEPEELMRFELAVAYEHGDNGQWEAGHFFDALSEQDAHAQFEDELGKRQAAWAQVWTYGISVVPKEEES